MTPIEELIQMSKYAGERFDLVQAGGGNTSVKYGNNEMHIKASGYLLSEVSQDRGYTTVDLNKTRAILDDEEVIGETGKREKDAKASKKLQSAILFEGDRPSIETYLHALLYKYTFHAHAIAVNIFTSHKNWEEKMKALDETALCIRYETPGIDLALEMKRQLEGYIKAYGNLPKVIFLQNHGLIISSDNLADIEPLTEGIVVKAEKMVGVDFSKYRNTTKLSKCFNSTFGSAEMAYFSEDSTIYYLLKTIKPEQLGKPFSPDGYVFCGYTLLEMDSINTSSLREYQEKYVEPPKIILYNGHLYFMAGDLKKAKMIEDVFKNNLLIINSLNDNLQHLEDEEIRYLGNWEAEKYRQKLS